MDDRQKKEIEAKWKKLLEGGVRKSPAKQADVPAGAKVIRRRKGQKDRPIHMDRE
ncbi:MAG: hypothetical protein PVJ84_20790 [Desulfobacteraceae bacterium]|jgi:hypothetical protein